MSRMWNIIQHIRSHYLYNRSPIRRQAQAVWLDIHSSKHNTYDDKPLYPSSLRISIAIQCSQYNFISVHINVTFTVVYRCNVPKTPLVVDINNYTCLFSSNIRHNSIY